MKERNRRVGKDTILYFAKDEFCNAWVVALEDFIVKNNKSVDVQCRCLEDGCSMVLKSYDLYEEALNKRYRGEKVFIANDVDAECPFVTEDGEGLYSFEVDEVDDEQNKIPINDREEMVFEVPKGFECAIEEVDGKSKVVMRKPRNVLKASGLSYDDFGLECNSIDYSTYKHIKAVNALSYIRMHDKDFLINDICWEVDLCYIGWDSINGNIEIRETDAVMGASDIRVGNELLMFNDEGEAEKFIKRYSDTICMDELLCNYYRFDYEK